MKAKTPAGGFAGFRLAGRRLLALGLFAAGAWVALAAAEPESWVGTWAAALQAEAVDQGTPALAGATLRQSVHVSLGGQVVRVRFSNAFGATPLSFHGAQLAVAAPGGAIRPGSDRPLRFSGRAGITIPPGASYLSDPVEFNLAPQSEVAITVHLDQVPTTLSVHPGSRTTSYVQAGEALAAPALPEAAKVVHWYFITALDVAPRSARSAALLVLGDSITDGYGTKPDTNTRWPDELVRRLGARPDLPPLAVLNLGIGGNHLLTGGLGPNALARFDRDVLTQAGARWLLVFEGINDLGSRVSARAHGADYAKAADLIAAFEQMIARAKDRGLRVIGGTILPYEGADYWSPDGEADRQTINQWIRSSRRFDAVVDFDAALRDPAKPTRLAPAFDCGDHLHPSLAGFQQLAATVNLDLFSR